MSVQAGLRTPCQVTIIASQAKQLRNLAVTNGHVQIRIGRHPCPRQELAEHLPSKDHVPNAGLVPNMRQTHIGPLPTGETQAPFPKHPTDERSFASIGVKTRQEKLGTTVEEELEFGMAPEKFQDLSKDHVIAAHMPVPGMAPNSWITSWGGPLPEPRCASRRSTSTSSGRAGR